MYQVLLSEMKLHELKNYKRFFVFFKTLVENILMK